MPWFRIISACQGLVCRNPICSDRQHQEPQKQESQGSGSPAACCSFKSICGQSAGSPLSLPISGQAAET